MRGMAGGSKSVIPAGMTGARLRKTAAAALLALAAGVAAPGALDASADKALSATGTVSRVQASARTVVVALTDGGEATFVWNTDTKISGVLTPGAKVTVRYVTGPNGGNLALQITVARS
jgi:hypothetical protein